LQALLDEMEQSNPSREIPIAINCISGVGRTGTIAVSYYLRREIDAQLASGTSLDDIRVNIPEVIYKFRIQRPYTAGRALQLVQLYSVLASYVEKLKHEVVS
jgi:protein tyrosine phosphatase